MLRLINVKQTPNTEDLIDLRVKSISVKQPKGVFTKSIGFLKKKIPLSYAPKEETRSLDMDDFRFLNFQDVICPKKVLKHMLKEQGAQCECKKKQYSFTRKFEHLMIGKCLDCDFVPNRKLLISLFICTGTKENSKEHVMQVKMLTDCSLFIGGFTGKDKSSYLLLGNSYHENFLEKFEIKRQYKRGRKNDTEGFEIVGAEELRVSNFENNETLHNGSSIWEIPMDKNQDNKRSNRRSSFIRDMTPESEIKSHLFDRNQKIKLFYLDPHYIQVSFLLLFFCYYYFLLLFLLLLFFVIIFFYDE
jgi:hypothetical protein